MGNNYASCEQVSSLIICVSLPVYRVYTYNGNFATEMVLDFARFDGIWGVFRDDLVEV